MPKVVRCTVPGCRRPMRGRFVILLSNDQGETTPIFIDLCADCRRKVLKVPGALSELLAFHN
jgi:hypothetical protein